MRRLLPIILCVPTALTCLFLLYCRLAPVNGSQEAIAAENEMLEVIGVTLIALSLLSCVISCVMLLVRPGAPEWRLATLFIGPPLLLALVVTLLLQ